MRRKGGGGCLWTEDEDGVWFTECGSSFWFDTGTPEENKCRFCHYCGKPLRTKRFQERA